MRLKPFNIKKEKNPIEAQANRNKILIFSIIGLCILTILLYQTYSIYQLNKEANLTNNKVGEFSAADVMLAVYINGEKSNTFPRKNDGYVFERAECTEGATGSWDSGTWSFITGNLTKPTECNIYFKEASYCELNGVTNLKDCIIGTYGGTSIIKELSSSEFSKASPSPVSYIDNGLSETETTQSMNSTSNYYWGTSYTFNETTGLYQLSGTITQSIWNSDKVGLYTLLNISSATATSTTLRLITAYNSTTQANVKTASGQSNPVYSKEDSGLFKMADDYGTSYYFRGHRDYVNNNVIFAGFQWKIIRILGDGSIRMIYNGTEAQFTSNGNTVNTTGTNTQIGTSEFNRIGNDNTHVGYKYGTTGASSYAAAHSNTTNSTIKTTIDNWYASNIVTQGTAITNKVVDKIFCNDRQLYSGVGYGTNATYYAPYNRLNTNKLPKLTCTQSNDQFTISSGRLTYPVALITADEVSIAGGLGTNRLYYLYTNQYYWTMSPADLYVSTYNNARLFTVNEGGTTSIFEAYYNYGARPVINLSSTVTFSSGDGSATNPFRIA